MSFSFKKRVKIAPFLYLNLSKSGISASVGGKGAVLNLRKKGANATLSIPNTGISYRKNLKLSSDDNPWLENDDKHKSSKLFLIATFAVIISLMFL
ncbi:DUF4236 domain-containing protein [Vibrio cholerae]